MGNAYAVDLAGFSHGDPFLFGNGAPVGKLVAGNLSAAFHKSYDILGVAFRVWNII